MGTLSKDLRGLGYEPTERESPFNEDGRLWANSFELVCDQSGIVIRKDSTAGSVEQYRNDGRDVCRYNNSNNVKLIGGFLSGSD